MIHGDRLAVALWEADRHAAALDDALVDWDKLAEPTVAVEQGEKATVRLADQLLFRFTKLQDAMGERLVTATLASLAEPCDDWPMRDRLNRLEKLGFVDVGDWLRWRELRNRLAHEYPQAEPVRRAALAAAVGAARELRAAFDRWRKRLAATGAMPKPDRSS